MKRYMQKAFAALMCAFLVGTCAPAPVLADEGGGVDPSVGAMGEFAANGQAATVVNVLPYASSITEDFAASIEEIANNPAFDLVVKAAGTAPFAYQWFRAEVDAEGNPGEAVKLDGETGFTYALSQHADTLADETAYVFTVVIVDGQQREEELSVRVTVSGGYEDRTLPDDATLPRVQGLSIHKDAALAVAQLDDGAPSYGFLQQAAEGMKLDAAAWQLGLAGAPAGKDSFVGKLTVTLPLSAEALEGVDAAGVKVAQVGSDGASALHDAVVDKVAGTVTCTVDALGAFAVAYPSPAGATFAITATAGAGGAISPEGKKEYAAGSTAVYTVLPDPGYVVKTVMVDGVAATLSGNTYTFGNVQANHTIAVTFQKSEGPVDPDRSFTVRALVEGGHGLVGLNGGTPSDSVELSVLEGGSVTVNFVPADGYVISSVTVKTGQAAPEQVNVFGSSFLLAAVTADTVVAVRYAQGSVPPTPTHVVTAAAGPGGSVSPVSQTVPHAGSATVSVIPNKGYMLKSVLVNGENRTGDVSRDGALVLYNVVRDTHVQATFSAVSSTCTVTVSAGKGGSIEPSGAVSVQKGAAQTFSFKPAAGKRVAFLTVDGARFAFHGSSYTLFDIDSDASIAVEFEDDPVDPDNPPLIDVEAKVVVSSGGEQGGIVSPSGALTVAYGSSQTFHVFPEAGYDLDKVLVNGHQAPVQPVGSPTLLSARSAVGAAGGYRFVIENMTATTNIDVHFKKLAEGDPVPPPVTVRSVTATATTGGMISPAGTTWVADGGSVSFTVKADEKWHLASLTVDGQSDATDQVVGGVFELSNVEADAEVRAVFEPDEPEPVVPTTHRITAQASAGGSIDPSGAFDVRAGSSVTFKLTADEGCKLASLVVNGREALESVENGTYTMTDVREDAVVYAAFRRVEAPVEGPYSIEASVSGGHGTVSPTGTVLAAAGSDQAFYFYPDAGYTVDAVVVDGERLSWAPRSHTFENVRADHTLAVSFKPVAVPVGGVERPVGLVRSVMTKTGDELAQRCTGLIAMAVGAAAVAAAARRRMKGRVNEEKACRR